VVLLVCRHFDSEMRHLAHIEGAPVIGGILRRLQTQGGVDSEGNY